MKVPLLLGGGAVAVLGIAFLLGREGTTPGVKRDASAQQTDYGYVALDAEVLQTADDGSRLYALTAARIEQNPGSGDVAASTLTLRYGPDPARRWTLGAEQALLPAGSTRIRLSGNVQVRGKPPGSEQFAQINTQRLDVDTRTQDVSTRQPVSITWSGQQLSAQGLTANLKQDHLHLESSVHGRFSR